MAKKVTTTFRRQFKILPFVTLRIGVSGQFLCALVVGTLVYQQEQRAFILAAHWSAQVLAGAEN